MIHYVGLVCIISVPEGYSPGTVRTVPQTIQVTVAIEIFSSLTVTITLGYNFYNLLITVINSCFQVSGILVIGFFLTESIGIQVNGPRIGKHAIESKKFLYHFTGQVFVCYSGGAF
jgi:hypothetical protein